MWANLAAAAALLVLTVVQQQRLAAVYSGRLLEELHSRRLCTLLTQFLRLLRTVVGCGASGAALAGKAGAKSFATPRCISHNPGMTSGNARQICILNVLLRTTTTTLPLQTTNPTPPWRGKLVLPRPPRVADREGAQTRAVGAH
jgi:hypothetical protein